MDRSYTFIVIYDFAERATHRSTLYSERYTEVLLFSVEYKRYIFSTKPTTNAYKQTTTSRSPYNYTYTNNNALYGHRRMSPDKNYNVVTRVQRNKHRDNDVTMALFHDNPRILYYIINA